MTLDAMHWVWNHSQSKGNTRTALLYVADQVRTIACEVRIGQRELMKAINTTSKATAESAIRKAAALGELEVKEESSGRRPALYKLPKAAGYVRPIPSSAPETGAQGSASAPETGAQDQNEGFRSAPETGAQGSASAPVFAASAPETGAPPHTHKEHASGNGEQQQDGFQICQPLIQAMTEAGITVSWSMKPADWTEIARIVRRAGVPAMVDFARKAKASSRQPILYATYFLRGGWKGLPPASTAPPPRPSAAKPPYCGDPDCDEISRMRQSEDANGLRSVRPCPDCHPSRKETAA